MELWQCNSSHEFIFLSGHGAFHRPNDRISDQLLRIIPGSVINGEWETRHHGIVPTRFRVPNREMETLKLLDVYGPGSRLREALFEGQDFAPLYYVYSMWSWRVKVDFLGAKLARADIPIFSLAVGCCPLQDCIAIEEWEEIKAAFAARTPTPQQRELNERVRREYGLGVHFNRLRAQILQV